uniref:Uncharacterized protein n=1 Tax=Nymphaea colorata TaxID=210225 RepID=A0A5K1DHC6_9MAGN
MFITSFPKVYFMPATIDDLI